MNSDPTSQASTFTLNPAHADLPPLTTNPGELTSLKAGSQDATTYAKKNKKTYSRSSSIKFQYLMDHSFLDQYVLEYGDHKVRVGQTDHAKPAEYFAFHNAGTGKYIGSFAGPDQLASYLARKPCSTSWKDFTIVRNGVQVGSLQEFRHNWAKVNGRLEERPSGEDASGGEEEGDI